MKPRRFNAGLLTWLCGWLLAAGFVVWHAVLVERYLDRVTATRFSAEPLKTPLQRIPLEIAPDGQTWIRHSLAMAEDGAWRLRSTDTDNAPDGRPIYWNSGWALWLSACGRVRMAFTGESLIAAIEGASLWANLPVFLVVLTLASGWVWRRWGGSAGALAAIALAGHRKFYEGFYPAYCDHHGLISASVLGVVLGVVMAGAGWWKRVDGPGFSLFPRSEGEVMRAATISAVCGALGMWVSAASLVVTIGFTGIAVLLVAAFRGHERDDGLVCVPGAWSLWGRVGAVMSLGFYLSENFPDRLGLRLEANHPLYSLAWWGAGEFISVVLAWRLGKRSAQWLVPRLVGWGVAVLVAPATVWAGGSKVFSPLEPFLLRIHSSINEFEPLWPTMARSGWMPYADQLLITFLIVVLLVTWLVRKFQREERMLGVFIGSLVLAATVQGWYQNRWLLTASGPQIVLVLVLLLGLTARMRVAWRAVVLAVAGLLLYAPGPWMLGSERLLVERVCEVQLGETTQLLYRDMADALLKSGADKHSIVLSDPNASVGVGYYGRLRTVGTLYWENHDGLLAAAEMLAARDDAEVAARIRTRGITHVALISRGNFLSEYSYALHGVRYQVEDRETFGYRLLYQNRVPVWLRPLDYRVPTPLAHLGFNVALFKVDFSSPVSVAYERIGLYQLAKGERGLAEASFMAALAADTSRSELWLRQGELMMSDGRLKEALSFIRAGIARAPVDKRENLIRAAASLLTRQGPEGREQAQVLLRM